MLVSITFVNKHITVWKTFFEKMKLKFLAMISSFKTNLVLFYITLRADACLVWFTVTLVYRNTWNKVFKNGISKICGRQPLKNLKGYGILNHIPSNFLRLSSTNFTWPILEYFLVYAATVTID